MVLVTTTLIVQKKKIRIKLPSKKISIILVVLIVIVTGLGFLLNEYLKPVYVIGDISITKEDISQYASAIDEYSKGDENIDFGGESKQVATDDLVLNAAFINEMDKRNNNYYKEAKSRIEKKNQGLNYSNKVKKMLSIRQENEDYKKQMAEKLISIKDFTMVSVPLDSPLFLNKTPEQVKALRQEALDRLNKDFLPDIKAGKSKEEIAKKADVVVFDDDDTDNNNWQQYEQKNVVTIDYREGYSVNHSVFNDQDITSYYDVEVADIVKTDTKIATLGGIGDTTDVFASKAGLYMILRLDNATGGKYDKWSDMLKDYKQKFVNSKFAYLPTDSSTILDAKKSVVNTVSNLGLQKAQAAVAGGCNSHIVNFHISSFDIDSWARISGMKGRFVRNAPHHSCGSQWLGTKSFTTNTNGASIIQDNCWGAAPQWYLDQSPAGYSIVDLHSAEGFFGHPYYGWPKWTSATINSYGTVYTDAIYKKTSSNNYPDKASGITTKTCDRIRGFVFDKSQYGYVVNVSLFFDVNPSPPPANSNTLKKWDIGIAKKKHNYVGSTYGIGSDNYGFDVDPRKFTGINIQDGKSHTVWAWASSVPGNDKTILYQFAQFIIPACPPPAPSLASYEPRSVVILDKDAENPELAIFSYGAALSGHSFTTTVTPRYYIKRYPGGNKESINRNSFEDPKPPVSKNIKGDWDSDNDGKYKINNPVSTLSLNTGDQVCANLTINPGEVKLDQYYKIIAGSGKIIDDDLKEDCETFVNKPYIGFYGNDVKAGLDIDTVVNCKKANLGAGISAYSDSNHQGSGVQIAAFALGDIDQGFTTAKKNGNQGNESLSLGKFGSFGSNCTHDYFKEAPTNSSPVSINAIGSSLEKQFKYSSDQSFNGVSISAGSNSNKYVYVEGDVKINNDVKFLNTASTIDQLPSFYLVVKGNIYIQKDVAQLDGVYVAQKRSDGTGGQIYTCANGDNQFAEDIRPASCNLQLVVNGVFIGQKMYFDRTFGSLRDAVNDQPFLGVHKSCSYDRGLGAVSTCAAEVFNFNPSLFLANSPVPESSSKDDNRQVPFSTSLPPLL